jgi:hypothetical protein
VGSVKKVLAVVYSKMLVVVYYEHFFTAKETVGSVKKVVYTKLLVVARSKLTPNPATLITKLNPKPEVSVPKLTKKNEKKYAC